MPQMNLHWRFLNRPVKPVAFGLMLAMLVLAFINIDNFGVLGNSDWGDVLAGFSLAVAGLLAWGWWTSSQAAAEYGLIGACFVWTMRFWLAVFMAPNVWQTAGVYLSLCWALISAGSYLLERTDENVGRGF